MFCAINSVGLLFRVNASELKCFGFCLLCVFCLFSFVLFVCLGVGGDSQLREGGLKGEKIIFSWHHFVLNVHLASCQNI